MSWGIEFGLRGHEWPRPKYSPGYKLA